MHFWWRYSKDSLSDIARENVYTYEIKTLHLFCTDFVSRINLSINCCIFYYYFLLFLWIFFLFIIIWGAHIILKNNFL